MQAFPEQIEMMSMAIHPMAPSIIYQFNKCKVIYLVAHSENLWLAFDIFPLHSISNI